MKIAIIGTGNIAKDNYIPVLSEIDDIELLYYSRTKNKAEIVAEKFGGTVVESMQELMGMEPDTTFILTREMDQYSASFSKSINAYIDSIRQNTKPPVPGITGLYELQFEAGLKQSVATCSPVILDDAFSIHRGEL